jgi:hypothetical protein
MRLSIRKRVAIENNYAITQRLRQPDRLTTHDSPSFGVPLRLDRVAPGHGQARWPHNYPCIRRAIWHLFDRRLAEGV